MDQDSFNLVFRENVTFLSFYHNFQYHPWLDYDIKQLAEHYGLKMVDGQIVKIYMEWQSATDILAKEREMNLKRVDEMQQEIRRLGKAEAETEKKLRETQQEARQLEQAKANNEKEMKKAQTEGRRAEQVKTEFEKQLIKTKKEAGIIKRELKNVKNSWSFKIGRIITYIPRKTKDALKK